MDRATNDPDRIDMEGLLMHGPFLLRLARDLLRDEDLAEEVVQQTWLAALQHGPRSRDTLRSWLATVARNFAYLLVRTQSRRRKYEVAAARPDVCMAADETLGREDSRSRLLQAVLELREPYREAIMLRYFEELPARDISRRLDVPVATVGTRLKRGLAKLRQRLDDDHQGDRRAWCLALLPLALGEVEPSGVRSRAGQPSAPSAGSPTRSARALALTGVLLALLTLGWWFTAPWRARHDVPTNVTTHSVEKQVVSAEALETGAPAPATRAAVSEGGGSPDSGQGSLVVRVTWEDDKKAAARVCVCVMPMEIDDPPLHVVEAVTDEDGTARFAGVPPGKARLGLDRGGDTYAQIRPGEQVEVRLEAPDGIHVEGSVVDGAGAAVPHAKLLLFGTPAYALKRSPHVALEAAGADGRFTLRAIAPGSGIAAWAPGYARSDVHLLVGGKGKRLPLTIPLLHPESTLSGVVLDPVGRPCAGAMVEAGRSEINRRWLEHGPMGMGPTPVRARTDALGRFRLDGLLAGETPVYVRGTGFAPWEGSTSLPRAGHVELPVTLREGATVRGTVKNARGQGVRAEVCLGDMEERVRFAITTSAAADGSFALVGLPAGKLSLCAAAEDGAVVFGKVEAVPGQTVRWDVTLSRATWLAGRVVDEAGAPIRGAEIRALEMGHGQHPGHYQRLYTDENGRYSFRAPESESRCRIEVFLAGSDVPSVVVEDVETSDQEITIRVAGSTRPSAFITGLFVDAEGAPVPHVRVGVGDLVNDPAATSDPDTGGFRLGPYPPGSYHVWYLAPGHASMQLPRRDLGRGEIWDVGTIRLGKPGRLTVTFRRQNGEVLTRGVPIQISREDNSAFVTAALPAGSFTIPMPLAPGRHLLQVVHERIAAQNIPFDVETGKPTHLDVTVSVGVLRKLRVQIPDVRSMGGSARLVVRDAADRLVVDASYDVRYAQFSIAFAPGTYRLLITSLSGLTGEATFEVSEGDEPGRVVEIFLR